ncbi:MAG: acyl carrier protein [Myxococcales bacterium]|nr:acyl carrier protein [Myxococcales bacterium]MDH5305772.1 acyl carrier protein [Myxococcales bacterium]MDH5565312.1 acyl carrier protein [Myxococcales bacterium]
MHAANEIFDWVADVLKQQFQIREEFLRPDARLVDDLDLDSVDAIDLSIRLEEKTGLSFKEEDLKAIETIQDIVDFVHERL